MRTSCLRATVDLAVISENSGFKQEGEQGGGGSEEQTHEATDTVEMKEFPYSANYLSLPASQTNM